MTRSISADKLGLLRQSAEQAMVSLRLFLYGQPKWVIDIPENISKIDLRREASKKSVGRVQVDPEVFPLKDCTVGNCIPSLVAESVVLDQSMFTAVPCLVHHGKKYRIEVFPDIPPIKLANVATNVMGASVATSNSTPFPMQTDNEINK
jgi:hypothetical protein